MSRREPGYRPEPKLYRVTFDDHPGLVVRARTVSVDKFMAISELADKDGRDADDLTMLFTEFARVLTSWNLDYNTDGPVIDQETGQRAWYVGEPVPTTLEGVLSQDFDFMLQIVLGWMEAVAGVPAPLDQPSSGGPPSLVESLPMEPWSPNQANSPVLA